MNYDFCFMMIVTIYIVHSVLKISLKSAVRQFTRTGRVPAVANDDHNDTIEDNSLSKQCFSFKHNMEKV